jgi:hypothetical protein
MGENMRKLLIGLVIVIAALGPALVLALPQIADGVTVVAANDAKGEF